MCDAEEIFPFSVFWCWSGGSKLDKVVRVCGFPDCENRVFIPADLGLYFQWRLGMWSTISRVVIFIKATNSLGVRCCLPQLEWFSFTEESSYSKCDTKGLKLERKKVKHVAGIHQIFIEICVEIICDSITLDIFKGWHFYSSEITSRLLSIKAWACPKLY